MKYLIITILIFAFPAHAEVEQNNTLLMFTSAGNIDTETGDEAYLAIGVFVPNNTLNNTSFTYFGKFELFFLSTGTQSVTNDYTGLTGGIGIHFNYVVTPYLEAGLIIGENEICNDTDNTCDKESFLGIFPELGLMIHSKGHFSAQFFARNFLLTKEVESFTAIGVSIGFRF